MISFTFRFERDFRNVYLCRSHAFSARWTKRFFFFEIKICSILLFLVSTTKKRAVYFEADMIRRQTLNALRQKNVNLYDSLENGFGSQKNFLFVQKCNIFWKKNGIQTKRFPIWLSVQSPDSSEQCKVWTIPHIQENERAKNSNNKDGTEKTQANPKSNVVYLCCLIAILWGVSQCASM